MTTNIEKIAEAVNGLQRDMAQVGLLVDRLDVTIEKLTEVSTTVSSLLAVQGNRLEMQEKNSDKLQLLLEKSRTETDNNIKGMYDEIEKVEKKFETQLNKANQDICQKISTSMSTQTQQHNTMEQRINRLEKYLWLAMGGMAVVVFLIENIVPKFFGG